MTAASPDTQRESWFAWTQVAAGIVLSLGLLLFARSGTHSAGDTLKLTVTVVPQDAQGLACDRPQPLGGQRCAFADGNKLPSVEHPLQPFVTVDRRLVLLSGLFETRSVAEWLERSRKKRRQDRVRVTCSLTALPAPGEVGIRFGVAARFDRETPLVAGRVLDCQVKQGRR